MWADNETSVDLLGFKVHADLIRAVVTDPDLLPITIGVFGDWGGGKTSVMKMLKEDLDPETADGEEAEKAPYEGVACLYFNGWLFEGYDDAKSAILSSILLQLGAHKRFGPRVRDKAFSLLQSVDWMRLARLGFKEVALPATMAYITGGVSLLPSFIGTVKTLFGGTGENTTNEQGDSANTKAQITPEQFFKPSTEPSGPTDVRTFRDRFSEMLKDSDIESLVVLIDDLDRCSPQRIIDNLEAIKLFLSVDRTAFVIGADPRIVRHAIATVYDPAEMREQEDPLESQTNIITDYLEKVIQVPYRLPRLSPSEVETYMSLLFCQRDLDHGTFAELCEAHKQHIQGDRYTVFGLGAIRTKLGDDLPEELLKSLTFSAGAAPLITEGLKGNPRQVKRFLNAYVLRKKLADVAKLVDIRDDVLVKLMILEYAHPTQFNQLYGWQASQEGTPEQLGRLEKALCPPDGDVDDAQAAADVHEDWSRDFVRSWVAMEPQLSDIDLRDYFWVARDRLQSTLSGVSLIPPLVRRLLDDLLSENPSRIADGVEAAKELGPDELAMLIESIARQVERHPEEKNGFDALRALTEADLTGSAAKFAEVLSSSPPQVVEPAVGMDLLTLLREKRELRERFEPVIENLRGSKTPLGATLEEYEG